MEHEAHVRLVDAHAERDCRDDHDTVLLQECVLVARAHGAFHAGVIRKRINTALVQERGELLGLAARCAIDDAASAAAAS